MVQDSSILEKKFIFLLQTKNKDLERRVANSVRQENIRLESVINSGDVSKYRQDGQIIAFIIASDVQDPIQSAQRLHALKKSATIIILSKPEHIGSLQDAVRFSPFIGTEIFCLDESKQARLEKKLNEILTNSHRAEQYRNIVAKANSRISLQASSRKSAFNQSFITKLMDTAPIGIAVVGHEGKLLGWNKEAAVIFNQNEAQVLGKPLTRLLDQPEAVRLKKYLRKCLEKDTGEPTDPLTLTRRVRHAPEQALSFTAAPFTYAQGMEKGLILAIKDVTQNMELLDRLKTAVEARDHFLAMASHELRTPLTSMRMNLDLLKEVIKRDLPDPSDSLKLNDKSLKQTDRLIELIEDLFDVAKIHSGRLDFHMEEFNLSAFIRSYLKKVESKFTDAGCEPRLNIQPGVVGVWDKNRIGQAFSNLITNAIKYAPGDPVTITLKSIGRWARLSVADQGPGISQEKQQKVFERFERATDSQTIAGLGLGLYITKKIVEGHGGTIQIQSVPDEGSTFTLHLPLDLDPEKPPEGLGVLWQT